MTLSLAAVFIPVLFMSGILGRLFHEFAVTIMVAILISGFVSLSLTPMLCSRFLKPPGGTSQRFLPGLGEGLRRNARSAYDWTLARRHAPPLPDHAHGRRHPGRPPSSCSASCPKASSPTRTPASFRATPKLRRTSPSTAWRAPAGQGGRGAGRRPEHRCLLLQHRHRRRPPLPATPGVSSSGSSRATSAASPPSRSSKRCAPSSTRFPASAPICRIRRWCASADRSAAASISTRCKAPTSRSCIASAVDFEKRMRTVPGLLDVNSDLQIASPLVTLDHRPRPRLRSRCDRRPDGERALRRLRRAPGVLHLHLGRYVLRDHGTAAEIPARPQPPGPALHQLFERPPGPDLQPWRSFAPASAP